MLFPSTVRSRTWNKEKRTVAADGSPIVLVEDSVESLTSPGPDYIQVSELRDNHPVPIDTIVADLGSLAEVYAVASKIAEMLYIQAIALGAMPQEARGVLPGCLKTEMILTGRFSDWAHFLKLRNDPTADPQMQYIALEIEKWFCENGHEDIRLYDRF
jgi:thymidylate synthase ThyX